MLVFVWVPGMPAGPVPRLRFACRLPRIVGAACMRPVDVGPVVTFLGKGAKPGPALQDLLSSLAIAPSFLTGQKGSEKAAANSEARGTARVNPGALQHRHALPSGSICCVALACNTYSIAAPSLLASATVWQAVRRFRTAGFTQGPAGPFGNPGALMGSPETVSVPHKANALCYNTVSLLPVRLIRAPVLKPRPRSQAGRSAVTVCLACSPAVPGRFVGAACMRPVAVFDTRSSRFVARFLRIVGRGLDPAAH